VSKYTGGVIPPRQLFHHGLPKGLRELDTVEVGAVVDVWDVFSAAVFWSGEVVAVIDAGVKPDPAAMEVLFRVSRMATGLKQPTVPKLPSKYQRCVVRKRTGRCIAIPLHANTYKLLPGTTKEER
jgi:hypothetical protein